MNIEEFKQKLTNIGYNVVAENEVYFSMACKNYFMHLYISHIGVDIWLLMHKQFSPSTTTLLHETATNLKNYFRSITLDYVIIKILENDWYNKSFVRNRKIESLLE